MESIKEALAMDRNVWGGANVCILDRSGSWDTLSVAETLAQCGARVSVISGPDDPLWQVNIYSRMTAMERLAKLGVRFRPGLASARIVDGRLQASNKFTGDLDEIGAFTHFLHASRGTGDLAVQSALEAQGQEVHCVGDALAPRSLLEAVYEGHAVARSL